MSKFFLALMVAVACAGCAVPQQGGNGCIEEGPYLNCAP